MGDTSTANACGTIQSCTTLNWSALVCEEPGHYPLELPASNIEEAVAFLEHLGGPTAGAGRALHRIGVDAPKLRKAYKTEIEAMVSQISVRLARGDSKDSIAQWASSERVRIVKRMRSSAGPIGRATYEIRDWRQYGYGGRTWANVQKHYAAKGVTGTAMADKIIAGAQKSNANVNASALTGAAFLKNGGRVVVVVGAAMSVARIWSAKAHELPRVIGEEAGGFFGGSAGAGAVTGACMVFGVATGGWGLLACGAVGGFAGGILGGEVGGRVAEGVYYGTGLKDALEPGQDTVHVSPHQLHHNIPREMSVCQ